MPSRTASATLSSSILTYKEDGQTEFDTIVDVLFLASDLILFVLLILAGTLTVRGENVIIAIRTISFPRANFLSFSAPATAAER